MTLNTHVSRALSAFAILGTFAFAGWAGSAIASADTSYDPFDQRTFPCQEDEVLGYAPQFGPDRVGCIHIDALRTVELTSGWWAGNLIAVN